MFSHYKQTELVSDTKENSHPSEGDESMVNPPDPSANVKTLSINNNHIIEIGESHETDHPQSDRHCISASLPSLIIFSCLMIFIVVGHRYVVNVLLYIDALDLWQSALIFEILFLSVSFPVMWGYVLLNIACGYTYGFLLGTTITCICGTSGMMISHCVIRRFFRKGAEKRYISNKQTKLLMDLVAGSNGWKIVFLARLSPIPFGIQNTIFAVSNIKSTPYFVTCICAQLITQMVYAYMGSTFRSIAQVFSSGNTATTWTVLSIQAAVTITLTVFIMRLAKKELTKNIPAEGGVSHTESRGIQTSDTETSRSMKESQPLSHSRNLSVNIPPIIQHPRIL